MDVTLSKVDQDRLVRANELLTELTLSHSHACGCELCRARALADVQDRPGCWTIPGVLLAE